MGLDGALRYYDVFVRICTPYMKLVFNSVHPVGSLGVRRLIEHSERSTHCDARVKRQDSKSYRVSYK